MQLVLDSISLFVAQKEPDEDCELKEITNIEIQKSKEKLQPSKKNTKRGRKIIR